jgi:hypothetical protein
MVVDVPRGWRWVIGGACGALLLSWFVFFGGAPPGAFAADVAPQTTARPSVAAEVGIDEPAPSPAEGVVAAHAIDEVQVCGGAWVKLQADGAVDNDDFERAAQMTQGRERILAALRASTSDLARAAAVLLTTRDFAQSSEVLARMALASTDARLYALAFKACGAGSATGEGACRMLSAAQWARIDPGNAAPWQSIFAAAASGGDRPAQDEALFQMANARHNASGFFDLVGAVVNATPDDDASQLAGWLLATQAVGLQAAVTLPGLRPMLHGCRGEALRDANRAQSCAALAEMMTERSDTLLDSMMGAAIGRQIGWPGDRYDRIHGEYRAYLAQTGTLTGVDNEFGCASLRRGLALVRRHAAIGEVRAMREWVRESGKRPEDFIADLRASRQGVEAQAAAASLASSSVGGGR